MSNVSSQLSLAVNLPDDETFDSFHHGPNDELLGSLQSYLDGNQAAKAILIVGEQATGKSHLLHAACSAVSESGSAFCIDLSCFAELAPAMLDNLENCDLVCLDNIDSIAGQPAWEQAVFDLFNRLVENHRLLVMTATSLPADMGIKLPDLISRLNWGLTRQVRSLDDKQKCEAIQQRAAIRGLELSDEAGQFLLTHFSRNMRQLVAMLDTLDKASMREQRRLTIPFIKSTLPQV